MSKDSQVKIPCHLK